MRSLQTVFFLCARADFVRERLGYLHAFERCGIRVLCLDDAPGADRNLRAIAAAGLSPDLILHPDPGHPVLPRGLAASSVPTACFQIDSFVGTTRRGRWSLLFDQVFVFHASDLDRYRGAGHPKVVQLFHAAEAEGRRAVNDPRDLEVAIVGRTDRQYQLRLRCLQALVGHVQTNEWWRPSSPTDVASLYGRAKIVLNVGRDDYRQDVGVRFGEAMVAGALFVTVLPTELTSMGYVEGRDFVGFNGPHDIARVCRLLLEDDAARLEIAAAGQAKLLRDDTYDRRVVTIVGSSAGQPTAPARRWTDAEVALTRLDYFAAKGMLPDAFAELRAIGLKANAVSARAMIRFGVAAGRQAVHRVMARG